MPKEGEGGATFVFRRHGLRPSTLMLAYVSHTISHPTEPHHCTRAMTPWCGDTANSHQQHLADLAARRCYRSLSANDSSADDGKAILSSGCGGSMSMSWLSISPGQYPDGVAVSQMSLLAELGAVLGAEHGGDGWSRLERCWCMK
eukprot:CAMPEP_0174705818 /NCGR_PEP_ID=MMETSP1094-20130205/8904_1 /TAXON_ID=156173 /ORGANISM="Chrysochromulina brevifilum, Strain UTEX LB 985" /LENGTH=144 /DNA_ID=CAMNT_0015904023 /DNA_START=216 /DNA_END=650 /DNA_ORIENTATION=+